MIQYSQRDPRWKSQQLGFGDCNVNNFGCLLTATATVISNYGNVVTPGDLNAKLKAINGFDGSLMYFGVLANLFPVNSYLYNKARPMKEAIDLFLAQGITPIIEIDSSPNKGFQNHWVVVYKKEGDTYLISDPWSLKPENETVKLSDRYGYSAINNIFVIELKTPVSNPVPVEIGNVESGKEIIVLAEGLRLRNGPSTSADAWAMLPAGTKLVSGGNAIKDGDITWQPVVMYVAANYGSEPYIKKVE